MALTRDYKQTVVARIKRDRKFARALYAQALGALLEGDGFWQLRTGERNIF